MEEKGTMHTITREQLDFLRKQYPMEAKVWDIMIAKREAVIEEAADSHITIPQNALGVVMS